jgi:hypothetical protein
MVRVHLKGTLVFRFRPGGPSHILHVRERCGPAHRLVNSVLSERAARASEKAFAEGRNPKIAAISAQRDQRASAYSGSILRASVNYSILLKHLEYLRRK